MARREGYTSLDRSVRSRFSPQKLWQYLPERMILRWNYSYAIALRRPVRGLDLESDLVRARVFGIGLIKHVLHGRLDVWAAVIRRRLQLPVLDHERAVLRRRHDPDGGWGADRAILLEVRHDPNPDGLAGRRVNAPVHARLGRGGRAERDKEQRSHRAGQARVAHRPSLHDSAGRQAARRTIRGGRDPRIRILAVPRRAALFG